MKKLLSLIVASAAVLSVVAQEYNHSIGATLGSLNGLSYKYCATEDFAFQLDFGFQTIETRTSGIMIDGPDFSETVRFVKPVSYFGGRLNPNLLWQREVADDWNFFLGGGFSVDMIRSVDVKDLNPEVVALLSSWDTENKYAVKFGVNAIMGIEYCFGGPVNLSLDFRPGYTVAYDNLVAGYKYYLGAFDWNLCVGVRYRFE
ncbi:MAG: hypothetical protein KBT41_07045 [bacterium]|nr:hypothetical protein [Candidatus Colousia faecequi]